MITLGTNLTNILKAGGAPFWAMKLFYNDDTVATNFIGISDQDRTISGTQYHGAAQWGTLSQTADIINYTAKNARMSLTLDNTNKAFSGQRFTDLLSSKNFINRKWELYLGSGTTLSSDTIGQGRTTGDIDGDDLAIQLWLTDLTSKFDVQIPANIVDISTYPDAPKKNIDSIAIRQYDKHWFYG